MPASLPRSLGETIPQPPNQPRRLLLLGKALLPRRGGRVLRIALLIVEAGELLGRGGGGLYCVNASISDGGIQA